MRNGQNKRMRNRNHRKGGQNPMTRVYESNGPEVKIRGTASHIAEKYLQLARDAQGSGDPVGAENYYQHAEHYFRIIAAAQEQFRQNQPSFNRSEGGEARDEGGDDEGDDFQPYGNEPFSPQPVYQQQPQPYQRNEGGYQQSNHRQPQPQPQPQMQDGDIERLPSFITGGQPQPDINGGNGNGHGYQDRGDRGDRNDRFNHRRRRHRHGGPRNNDGPREAAGGGDFDANPGNE
jgi:hypothetical protein